MTLDEAQDLFRDNPSPATASTYADMAKEYHRDEMIGDDTFAAVMEEIATQE